jgi:ArsR family transcriptional regulator
MEEETRRSEDALYDLADLFRMFGDSTRVRILFALSGRDLCVGDLADQLTMSPSAVSHQLRILKTARLVKSRREGKLAIYSLADGHVRTILDQGLDHVAEDKT